MTKPLLLTSPNHAWAVFVYLAMAFLGGSILLDFSSSRFLPAIMPVGLIPVWGLVMLLAGLACVTAALLATHASRPAINLSVEAGAVLVLAACLALYGIGGFAYLAQLTVPDPAMAKAAKSTISLFLILGAGAGARHLQLLRELYRLHQARKHRLTVIRESLADPADKP